MSEATKQKRTDFASLLNDPKAVKANSVFLAADVKPINQFWGLPQKPLPWWKRAWYWAKRKAWLSAK